MHLAKGMKPAPHECALCGKHSKSEDGRRSRHCQHDDAQHDAVGTKELEIVALDVIHQETDGGKAHAKGHHTAHCQHSHLGAGHHRTADNELDHLEQGCARHDRDGQIEGELCHTGAGQAQQQAAHDGGTGAGGARNDGQTLPQANDDGIAVGDLLQPAHVRRGAAVLHNKEQRAIQNEHRGNRDVIVEVSFHPVVQRADDEHRDRGRYHLEPQAPHAGLGNDSALLHAKGPQLAPEQHHHGHDGTQLDDHTEHGHELFACVEFDDLFQ